MPPDAPQTVNLYDFAALAPEAVLAVWGLVMLAFDLGPYRGKTAEQRKVAVGRLALIGSLLCLAVSLIPLLVRENLYGLGSKDIELFGFKFWNFLNPSGNDYISNSDPALFFGTIAGDRLTELFNLLFATLLTLVVWLSTSWSFTEDWGEYFALIFWSTVGMMLLIASEELLTLFLTLEMMTICLYLATAFEKDKKRSAEGGLKYFVYGSVSSALFLFGLSLIYGLTGSTQLYAIHQALGPSSDSMATGLTGNVAGVTAVLLILVGFGFKVAAVPFHQWAPDAYEGAPAPVTAWIATGSKVASFIALMKVLLHALGPWASGRDGITTPGWIGVVVVLSALSMTYGNFAALAQRNFKRMLAYSSVAHAGYMLVGVAAAGMSTHGSAAAGAVLFYLVTYAFANVGAFAVACWMARDKGSDEIEDLNGLGASHPILATCVTLLMLSLIGMPPLAGFFGKVSMFMEALREPSSGQLTLLWLVALGLMNSVVSAFYYVRVLKAMFLRNESGTAFREPPSSVQVSIILATAVSLGFGIYPAPLVNICTPASIAMLAESGQMGRIGMNRPTPPGAKVERPPDARPLAGMPNPGGTPTPPSPPSIPAPAAKGRGQGQEKDATKKAGETTPPAAKSETKGTGNSGVSQ